MTEGEWLLSAGISRVTTEAGDFPDAPFPQALYFLNWSISQLMELGNSLCLLVRSSAVQKTEQGSVGHTPCPRFPLAPSLYVA